MPNELIEAMARAVYADRPFKVLSQGQSDRSGLPLGSVLSYEKAIELGMDDGGTRRMIGAMVAFITKRYVLCEREPVFIQAGVPLYREADHG